MDVVPMSWLLSSPSQDALSLLFVGVGVDMDKAELGFVDFRMIVLGVDGSRSPSRQCSSVRCSFYAPALRCIFQGG